MAWTKIVTSCFFFSSCEVTFLKEILLVKEELLHIGPPQTRKNVVQKTQPNLRVGFAPNIEVSMALGV